MLLLTCPHSSLHSRATNSLMLPSESAPFFFFGSSFFGHLPYFYFIVFYLLACIINSGEEVILHVSISSS